MTERSRLSGRRLPEAHSDRFQPAQYTLGFAKPERSRMKKQAWEDSNQRHVDGAWGTPLQEAYDHQKDQVGAAGSQEPPVSA